MRLEHGFYHQTDQTCESKPKTNRDLTLKSLLNCSTPKRNNPRQGTKLGSAEGDE